MRSFPLSAPATPLLLGLLLALGCSSSAQESSDATPAERPENVRVLEVRRSDLDELLPITGRLRATRATDVSTQESGVVEAIDADKGTLVEEGEVIVRLDRRLLDAQRQSAEAMATLRRYNEERTRTLFEENQVSKQEMLKVHTELEQAVQDAEIARLRYERAAIDAPFAGMVTARYVELGQLVQPGQRVARVVDPYVLELEGYATEASVAYLREGAPASLRVSGMDEQFSAEVSWVSVEADPETGKFGVELRVPNPDLRARAGVVARAQVLKRTHESVIAIPRDAVVEGDRGPQVFVVEDEHARARPITLGPDQGLMVVARSGLDEGDRLVVRGQRELIDGARVEITEVSTRRDGSMEGDPSVVQERQGAFEEESREELADEVSGR